MKKLIIIVFTFLLIFSGSFVVKAKDNSIERIDIDVRLNKDGSANVTEKWETYASSGTEIYKSYGNLDSYEITNFVVKDEDGITYKYQSDWDVDGDFESKAHKNGINYNGADTELCWGISDYGDKKYTISYKITNMVKQYTDSQALYFTFVSPEMNVEPNYITIKISTGSSLNKDNSAIWAFGYPNGDINFKNGYILMDSKGLLSSNEYMTALVKFKNGMFNASDVVNISFDDLYDEAMGGVDYPDDQDNQNPDNQYPDGQYPDDYNVDSYDYSFISIVLKVIVIIAFIYVWFRRISDKTPVENFDFGATGNSLPPIENIQYWREIPCKGDLLQAYWILNKYGEKDLTTVKEGILGAILLKWVKEEKVVVTKTKGGLFNFKDNNYAIDFNNFEATDSNDPENLLLVMLKKASGTNNILEVKEFQRYCRNNYYEIDKWFSDTVDYETKKLITEGLITVTSNERKGAFGRSIKNKIYKVDPKMHEEAIHLLGLKKFLLEFSVIDEREIFEVHIWEEYLILAELFGIADKVAEQLSKLYPHFNEISRINTDITTFAIYNMAHIGYETIQSSKINHSSSSFGGFSSGGGGSSFSGGGSSSGGFSSSGGGGFR